jgi:hypothetical protein
MHQADEKTRLHVLPRLLPFRSAAGEGQCLERGHDPCGKIGLIASRRDYMSYISSLAPFNRPGMWLA